MNQILLSILIPTVYGREDEYEKLIHSRNIWNWYCDGWIEVLNIRDNKDMTIGEKREKLYQMAEGEYSWQIDDDDDISDNAIELILNAIKENPGVDCITFEEYCLMDGKEYKSNHSLIYNDWEGEGDKVLDDGFNFHRTPFYKNVIKTEIAKSVPFERIRWGEDHAWARALKPFLKTEYHIPEQIYRYIHNSSDPNERYGLNK